MSKHQVWRSKQSVFMNIIIDIVDTILQLIAVVIVGMGVLVAIVVFLIYVFTWAIQLSI